MLRSVGRVLEISVAANTDTWMVDDRRELIREMPASPRRLMSRALLEFAVACPKSAGTILDKIAGAEGYRYLGAGVEYSVYFDNQTNQAVKVHRDSANSSASERIKLVKEKLDDHAVLTNSLGAVILPQQVVLAAHPLGEYETLQVWQPFVSFINEDAPFAVNSGTVDAQRLESLVKSNPGLDDALQEFVDRSRNMYDRLHKLPDTNGANNVVSQPEGNVVLLDSTPIGKSLPTVQELVLTQLASLEDGLRAVA